MGDIYKEQLVKKEAGTDLNIRAGIIAAMIFAMAAVIFASLLFPPVFQFMPLLLIAVAIAAYYFFTMRNIEYEYIFTNGELDIDCIYNKTKRKRIFSAEVKSFESFEPYAPRGIKTGADQKDYSSGKIKDNTYMFVCTYKGKKVKALIEPNEKLLLAMQPYLGRKFVKNGRDS